MQQLPADANHLASGHRIGQPGRVSGQGLTEANLV
jgi:hypothetical protein